MLYMSGGSPINEIEPQSDADIYFIPTVYKGGKIKVRIRAQYVGKFSMLINLRLLCQYRTITQQYLTLCH